jgi:hypothetical protein
VSRLRVRGRSPNLLGYVERGRRGRRHAAGAPHRLGVSRAR